MAIEHEKDQAPPGTRFVQRIISRVHVFLYRLTNGKLGNRMFNSPVLLLTTTGRRSRQPRTNPLLYLEDGSDLVVVASNGGAPKHPDWWYNLQSDAMAEVQIDARTMKVRTEAADPAARQRLWPQLVAMFPTYEAYQKQTSRELPIVILHPVA